MVTVTLGFDTATEATAVGLRLADGTTLAARDDPSSGERPGHATRLLPLAGELLERARVGWSELERIAVGIGPGTFTGLRIGVSTARGLAQSLGIPLVGVSSLRALADSALAQTGEALDGVMSVIDARRGEVFAALYRPNRVKGADGEATSRQLLLGGPKLEGDAGEELLGPTVLVPDALGDLLGKIGADALTERWLAVGDGVIRYRELLLKAGLVLPPDDSPLHRITGEAICKLSEAIEPGDPQIVAPDYLRRPDAEIALEEARS